ncbi:MAG: ADP-ribosylglycohydrolase family protein [Actinomycetota bacterium]
MSIHSPAAPSLQTSTARGADDAHDRISGTLLGTALGDALGLPGERMSAPAIGKRFGRLDRFRLLGVTGFVSDDTEQAALIAQSLARHPEDPERCAASFRRSLLGWFARLPWGVGLATLRASFRIAAGIRPSGVRSAGNGAAMRAAVIGVFFHDRPNARADFGRALAETTHLDDRAVAGALFVAELAACLCVAATVPEAFASAARTVDEPQLARALSRAATLAANGVPTLEAAGELGVTGYVLHTVPFAAFCLLQHNDDPVRTLAAASAAGGDTDSIGAILGGWLGAWHGESGLPEPLLNDIHDGPFGPTHLRSLGRCLAAIRKGERGPIPGYSPAAALARNLALYPVILAHGFRRMLP